MLAVIVAPRYREQIAMDDLLNLRLDRVEPTVRLYRNLADHRHCILEGIRRIAFRNMRHVGDAMARARQRPPGGADSTSVKAWVARIHAIALADQGMEDTGSNRLLLEHSTFSPVRLYFALFYAEIEFFEECSRKYPWMDDRELAELLNRQGSQIRILKDFRDTFLHPQARTVPAEIELLQQDVQNRIPLLNKAFDDGLERVRQTIRNRLIAMLDGLPKVQQSYCRYRFLRLASDDWFGMNYPVSERDQKQAIRDLEDDIRNLPDDEKSWTPDPEQSRIGTRLAECLVYLIPFCPADSSVQPNNRQLPMDVRHLTPVLTIGIGVPRRNRGRAIKHVAGNIEHYRRVLIAVGVLLNEFKHAYAGLVGRMPTSPGRGARVPLDVPGNEMCSLIAPGKVAFALLAGLLRMYGQVVTENPWAAVPALDEVLENGQMLDTAVRFRNSVFHVPKAHLNPLELDRVVTDMGPNLLHSLFMGLSEFLGAILHGPAYDQSNMSVS